MHSSAAQTEDMAALAAIADQVGTHGGITSAAASSDLLDGGFAEQFREDQVTFGDPLYDTYYAEGDIFAATGLMSASGVTAVGVGVDLWTSPFGYDWEYGYTGPLWDIDVDGDDDYEYYTGIVNVDGSVGGALLDSADRFVCNVAVDWSPPTGAYMVGFPTACLGANVPQIRMRTSFLYTEVAAGNYDIDFAPDSGWSATIRNDAYVPPVSPPTTPVTPPGPESTTLVTVQPFRLYDSRSGGGVRSAGSVTEIQVIGRGGVSTAAATAVLNVTAVAPRATGS